MLLFPQHHFEKTLLISTLADFPTIVDNLLFLSLWVHLTLFIGFCLCKVDHIKTFTVPIIMLKSPTGYEKSIRICIKLSPGIYKMFSYSFNMFLCEVIIYTVLYFLLFLMPFTWLQFLQKLWNRAFV